MGEAIGADKSGKLHIITQPSRELHKNSYNYYSKVSNWANMLQVSNPITKVKKVPGT